MHLDPRTHRDLLAGTLALEEARALGRHLADGCDTCERFLAEEVPAGAADGRVDRALGALASGRGGGSDAEFARIELGLREEGRRTGRWRMPRGRRAVAGLAGAAALLVAGLATLVARPERVPSPASWTGEKGSSPLPAAPVRLRFLVVAEGGASSPADALRRGASGDAVSARASLEFEVELGRAGYVALVRVGREDEPEVFWRDALGAGPTLVTLDGRPASYRLEGLRGAQRFVAVASAEPLADDALVRAAAARAGDGAAPTGGSIATDAVEVRVE